ncbi:hypothetical protein BDZ94DRAFT_1310962 [Collybia nuda]|uniref:DUF6534 domain-containing protein n=1 Tax=Collybia nuda TaxID=64659 RepID=A0A9P5Y0D7_9AGAR|nr:hypothetical protein BDZ94DRAFT_1310962 [Collybia nuda]
MAGTTTPIPSDVFRWTCPLIVGYLLDYGLYGVFCVQVYYYYMAFPKDRTISKCLIFGLFLIETVQLILATHDTFMVFVIGFGNMDALFEVNLQWISVSISAGITSGIVQISFAYRIYVFSRSKIAGIIITTVALLQAVSALIVGVRFFHLESLKISDPKSDIPKALWFVGSAVCDVIITIFLTYFLSRQRTDIRATQKLITRVTRLTIENGFLTGNNAAVATLACIMCLLFPGTNYHVAPALLLGKLYSITLVTSFNSRLRIVNGRDDVSTDIVSSMRAGATWLDNDTQPDNMLHVGSRRSGGQVVTVDIHSNSWGNATGTDQSKEDEEPGPGDLKFLSTRHD